MASGPLTSLLLLWAFAAPPSNEIVPMNSRNFKIPISVKQSERAKMKELTLFVSDDEGKTWNAKSVAAPDKDAFIFYAPHDGLFWFTIAVTDQAGAQTPVDVYKAPPGQRILVDTLKPNVRIVSAEKRGDEIFVSWEIQEEHPDLSTLKLEYHTADGPAWAWYKVDDMPKSLIGQSHFRFVNAGSVIVKVEMLDQAGNLGGAQTEVSGKPAIVTAGSGSNPLEGPALGGLSTPSVNPPPGGPFAAPPSTSANVGSTAPNAWPKSEPVHTVANPAPTMDRWMPPTQPTVMQALDSRSASDRSWSAAQMQPQAPTYQQTGVYIPETTSRYSPASNSGSPLPVSTLTHWPSGPLPPLTIVNSTEVTLNYEVTGPGPSGVGSVELYITRDDGQSWQHYADDPDCKSPMTVNLPGEGIYGLRIVVGSRAGLGRRPPQNGDLPQMRVQVDSTPPTVKMLYPLADPHRRDVLILGWNATDANPGANPVTLLWSDRLDGQWRTIATELTNNGRYTWQLTPDLPVKVYLRVIVRDAAGNVAVDDLPQPVLVDLHEPEGHIIGIEGARGR